MKRAQRIKPPAKPKAGDRVSLKCVGYGFTTYEGAKINRVRAGKVYLGEGDKPWYDAAGKQCWPTDMPSMGLRVSVVFDGGALADTEDAA